MYDAADQAYGSVRRRGVSVEIDSQNETSIFDLGTIQYQTSSDHDLGRVTRSFDARSGETAYEYDTLGRQWAVVGPEVTVDGIPVRQRTETIYDELGKN